MSLILCPECGTKISDKALTCPHCGYMSADHSLPISVQDTYEVVPVFNYDVEEWNPNKGQLSVMAIEDNRNLVQYFGNWQTIQLKMPAIAQVIKGMAKKDEILVAKMDSYIKKLIDKGVYRFTIDKQGEILPTIRDTEGIVKQVRLEEMTLTPELTNSLNNLTTHAAMAQSHCFQTEKRRALTKPEQELFLDYLKNSPTSKYWYPVFAVMIGTGLRVGEVTGLRWCDIDLEEGVNVKVIQDTLGHKDISTTLNIYTDVTKELRKSEFEGLDSYFKNEYNKVSV